MPLFGRSKDRMLIKHFNDEVLKDMLDTPVTVFKLALDRSNTNIYGEAEDGSKTWKNGVQLYARVSIEDQEWVNSDFGLDVNQSIKFGFLNEHLTSTAISGSDGSFMIDPGDIVYYDSHYWEIDTTVRNEYLFGRNANTQGITSTTGVTEGESLSTIATAHLTRRSKLNIEHPSDIRVIGSGTNDGQGLYR